MTRRILGGLLALVLLAALIGYVSWRRDTQYATYVSAGEAAMQRGDNFGAIEAFSGAIALRRASMLAWLKRGEVYLALNDYRSALRDLRQAVALDPAALRPLELLGDAQAALDRHKRAAEHYDAYLRLDDRDLRVQYKLGVVRLRDGQIEAAIGALRHAARLDDTRAEIHYLLGLAYAEQEQRLQALRALQRAVALAPAMIAAREALAEQYRQAGRHADEVRQLEAIAALDPVRVGRHVAVADAWARAGQWPAAVTTLLRAMERFPDEQTMLLTSLGRVWLAAGEATSDATALAKAIEALRTAAARSPSDGALALLGRAQLRAGDARGALRSLQGATTRLPLVVEDLTDLAAAAERLGRLRLARDTLARVAALSGDSESASVRANRFVHLARLSDRLHDRAATVAWLERALAATPGDRALATELAAIRAG
jgi:tetratricopeptide (TPR) repeat protein